MTLFSSFLGLKLPTGGTVMGGAHGRTGSTIWSLRKFKVGWVKNFLLEVNGATNFQVHRQGRPKTAVPAADSQGPRGLIINSNAGFPWNI